MSVRSRVPHPRHRIPLPRPPQKLRSHRSAGLGEFQLHRQSPAPRGTASAFETLSLQRSHGDGTWDSPTPPACWSGPHAGGHRGGVLVQPHMQRPGAVPQRLLPLPAGFFGQGCHRRTAYQPVTPDTVPDFRCGAGQGGGARIGGGPYRGGAQGARGGGQGRGRAAGRVRGRGQGGARTNRGAGKGEGRGDREAGG